jgi:periplasmic protein TonB
MRLSRLAICVVLSGAMLWGFETPYRGVSRPIATFKPEPEYSQAARDAGLEGEVWLSAVIDEKGIPTEIKVTRSLGLGLDEKAIEAARKWRFKPAMKSGEPVASEVTIALSFRLLQRAK